MTGNELRAWRKDLRLTQEKMADKLGVSRRKYQYAEAAETSDVGRTMTLLVNGFKWDLERETA